MSSNSLVREQQEGAVYGSTTAGAAAADSTPSGGHRPYSDILGSPDGYRSTNAGDLDAERGGGRCCSLLAAAWGWKHTLLVLSVAGALLCGALLVALPFIVTDVVKAMVAIKSPASPIYDFWLDPDRYGVQTFRSFYLYNITNPLEAVLHGAAPNVVVRGPFAYREVWKKDPRSVRWYMNGTLGYRYEYRMFFAPERSVDAVTGEALSEDEVVTLPNGPLRGTMYRVGRLPTVVVEDTLRNGTLPNITQPMVCMLLSLLVNGTALGPKGVLVQRRAREVIWGYVDPIWDELHSLLGLFRYNASRYFQAQWNGSQIVPSPYTYRSGQMCPLWQTPQHCNRSGTMLTLEVSGRSGEDEVVAPMLPADAAAVAEDAALQAVLPEWMRRPGPLLDGASSTGEIVRYAGQLQGQWWWGPERDGMTGGSQPFTSVPLNAVRNTPPFRGWDDAADTAQSRTNSKPTAVPPPALREHQPNKVEAPRSMLASFMKSLGVVGGDTGAASSNVEGDDDRAHEGAAEARGSVGVDNNAAATATPVPAAACRRQYGSDGTRFPLPVTKGSTLQIFNDMMGRTFPFTFLRESTAEGLDTLRFGMDAERGMSSSAVNRFCFQQRFDGMINVSQFVFGDGIVTKGMFLDSCLLNNNSAGAAVHADSAAAQPQPVLSCTDAQWRPSQSSRDETATLPHAGAYEDGFTGPHLPLNITFSVLNDDTGGRRRYDFEGYMRKTLGDARGSRSAAFRERYDSFVDVLPLTGNTLTATARGMISLALGPSSVRGCNDLRNWTQLGNYTRLLNMTDAQFLALTNFTFRMQRTLMPYLQLERTAVIGGEVLSLLKSKLALLTAARVTLIVLLVLAVIVAVVLAVILHRERRARLLYLQGENGIAPAAASDYDIIGAGRA